MRIICFFGFFVFVCCKRKVFRNSGGRIIVVMLIGLSECFFWFVRIVVRLVGKVRFVVLRVSYGLLEMMKLIKVVVVVRVKVVLMFLVILDFLFVSWL